METSKPLGSVSTFSAPQQITERSSTEKLTPTGKITASACPQRFCGISTASGEDVRLNSSTNFSHRPLTDLSGNAETIYAQSSALNADDALHLDLDLLQLDAGILPTERGRGILVGDIPTSDSVVGTSSASEVDLSSIFTTLTDAPTLIEDTRFTTVAASMDISNFVKIEDGHLEMSQNFKSALDTLNRLEAGDGQFGDVVADLQLLESGQTAGLHHLQRFIDYQVFKTGTHLQSRDEDQWAQKLAGEMLEMRPELVEQGVTKELLAAELGNHFMCRCRYSKPVKSFLRKDTPAFVQERLRVRDTEVTSHIFESKNGCSIAYDSTALTEDKVRELYSEQLANYAQVPDARLEFVPFDSSEFMVADVQIPIMENTLTLEVTPPGRDPVSITMGDTPEDVGYRLTDEPAGVFCRSLNRQRVVQIVGLDDAGREVALQLKGAGVPAYGFRSEGMTGGEFFKLNVEKATMSLRDFSIAVFEHPDVAPSMSGMAMAMDAEHAYSGGERIGAVSFRMDYANGIRVSNVLGPGIKPDAVDALQSRAGVTMNREWKESMMQRVAENLAITHLLGLNYDDSSLRTLDDLGVHGEFSDSGTLRNIDPDHPIVPRDTTLLIGCKTLLSREFDFDQIYTQALLNGIDTVGAKGGAPYQKELADIKQEILAQLGTGFRGRAEQLAFFTQFCASLGGPSGQPTDVQRAFDTDGVPGYGAALTAKLRAARDALPQFKRQRIIANAMLGQLDSAVHVYGISTEAQLRDVLNISAEEPFPYDPKKTTNAELMTVQVRRLKEKGKLA